MININLTPLKDNDSEYEKLATVVSNRFKCDWDDGVHDSYGVYVKQVEERARQIRTIRCKAEALVKEAEGLRIDEQISKSKILCREADSV